jgi:hypothetical protein
MRKNPNLSAGIAILVFLLLFSVAGIGTVSAWASNTEAQLTPSGSLVPGDSVVATMRLVLEPGGIASSGILTLSTPLSSPHWTVDILYGDLGSGGMVDSGLLLTSRESSRATFTISGFDLGYDQNILVVITVTGIAPENRAGQDISVLSVTQTPSRGTASYSSPVQGVLSPSDDIADPTPTSTVNPDLLSGVPELPALYYGTATLNGNPVSAGTLIEAKSGSTAVGSITVSESGKIGGSGAFDDKLIVSLPAGSTDSTLTFWIGTLQADQTAAYESGTSATLDLTFSGTVPQGPSPTTPRNSGGSGGGGGGGGGGYIPPAVSPVTSPVTATVTAPSTPVPVPPVSPSGSPDSPGSPVSSSQPPVNQTVPLVVVAVAAVAAVGGGVLLLIRRR